VTWKKITEGGKRGHLSRGKKGNTNHASEKRKDKRKGRSLKLDLSEDHPEKGKGRERGRCYLGRLEGSTG